jgi:hypothetical protein
MLTADSVLEDSLNTKLARPENTADRARAEIEALAAGNVGKPSSLF